jgi:DNA-binding FrmR family transcriptional regulator
MNRKEQKMKVVTNYKKAQSLLKKIEKMLIDDEYCIEIMQQHLAVMGLLRSAHRMLMEQHLNSCFRSAMESGSEKKKQVMIDEMLRVANLSQK